MHPLNDFKKNLGDPVCKRTPAALARWLHGLINAVLLCYLCGLGATYADIRRASPLAESQPNSAAPPRWAQLADPVFTHFNVEQGLPNPAVTTVAEDANGFIWVGTQYGLARWDGYHFKVYRPDPKNTGSLRDYYIRTMHTDARGRLWIGAPNGELARYDPEHDRFIHIDAAAKADVKGVHGGILSIADDGNDGLWVGKSNGLHRVMPDGSFRHLRRDAINRIPSNHARILMRDHAGRLWLGTDRGLAVQEGKSERFIPVSLGTVPDRELGISSIVQSSDGKVWVGTGRHGVFVIDAAGSGVIGPATPLLVADETGNMPRDERSEAGSGERYNEPIETITEAHPGEIWIGYGGSGILVVDSATMQTHAIRHDVTLRTGLSDNRVISMLRDRSGMLWIGTQNGLSLHDAEQKAIINLFGGPTRKGRILDADVMSATPMPDGSLWLGLAGGGVNFINPDTTQVAWLAADTRNPKTALPKRQVHAISLGENNAVYFATGAGLYRGDLLGRQVQRITILPEDTTERLRALLVEGNTLWLGRADGLWRVDIVGEATQVKIQRLPIQISGAVNTLERTGDGALWIGTSSRGLYRYNPITHALLHFNAKLTDPTALSHNNIASLLFDRRGRLWVATQGNGINLLAKPDAKATGPFQRIGIEQGMPNGNINKLLEDTQGRIWASTDNGLAVIDPDTLLVRALRRADGVATPSYWVNSGTKTAQGELLFGGAGGLTVVRPERLKTWDYRPPVVVTDVQLGGKNIISSQLNLGLPLSRNLLTIQPEANSIAVEFAALDYSAPQQNRYAYRLDGYDNDWINTDWTRRVAAYTNLPPGDYRLRLRGSNRDDVWTEQEMVVPLRVLPAWYQTWWFRFMEVMAAAAAVYALVQARTRYLRHRQHELEGQVQQRTEQLQQKQVELVDANLELNDSNSALNDANTALNESNTELALSVETLRQLGDIGRDITANLDAQIVFEALYQYVGGLLNTPALMIYRMNSSATTLEQVFGREDGQALPASRIPLDSPTSNAARSVRERQDLLLNFAPDEVYASHIPGTRLMLTSMFVPLIVDERVLGVLSIQSDKAHAYGERERLIFRTLSAYGAIALANAEALAALHAAQAQLVQQEKMASLGSLVAGVAHEINTPLGTTMMAISGASDAWQRLREAVATGRISKAVLDSSTNEGIEYTELALKTASRVAALIATFKTIAVHTESDRLIELDLNAYLSEVASLVSAPLMQAGHTLKIDVAPGLMLTTVPDALTEALTRILSNVLDHAFTHAAKGVLRIAARAESLDEQDTASIVLTISDNGVGIAAQDLPKVFDPFFTTKSGMGGHVGLGLHVAFNHITQRLKGKISIASTQGEGTTVTICLNNFMTENFNRQL